MRKYRARDANGMRVYQLVLPSAELQLVLVDVGFLSLLKADDHEATQAALQKMTDTTLIEHLTRHDRQ